MDNVIRTDALADFGERAARELAIRGYIPRMVCRQTVRINLRKLAAFSREEDAPEWYADNVWMARQRAAAVLRAYGRGKLLRRVKDGDVATALARRFREAGELTRERLGAFLSGVGKSGRIRWEEVCLIPAALGAVLLSYLAETPEEERGREGFTELRLLGEMDIAVLLEQSDPVDAVFCHDAVYPLMDRQSRADYCAKLRRLAQKQREEPLHLAAAMVNDGLHEALFPPKTNSGRGYIAAFAAAALALTLAVGFRWGWTAALLLLLPMAELVQQLFHLVLRRHIRAQRMPRLSLEEGIGPEGRTVCTVFALLSKPSDGEYYARRLEQFKLANRDCGDELLFALAADLPEGKEYPPPGGAEAMDNVRHAIEALNKKYGGGFFLLSREAVFDKRERIWLPRERKRGAMDALARLVCGKESTMECLAGDKKALHARYILCLDADTFLCPGTARAMIGTALHPLHRPMLENGCVVRGHGLIHPRMSTELSCAMATDFARIHLGQGGTDPYGQLWPELYFEMFGRGGFAGKGLVDAGCYIRCMEGRIPDNRVLSHDSLEGAYLRGAYLGDVELSDQGPIHAAGWFRRLERWTRGDWQNLPWLFHRELAPMERFRLFESLRRSLTPAAWLACYIVAFCFPSLRCAGALALLSMAGQGLAELWQRLFIPGRDARLRCRSAVLRGLGGVLVRLMSRLVLLPWESFCCLGAALTALWRSAVSHRNMLRWVPAGQSGRRPGASLYFAMALGLGLLCLCPGSLGKAVGLLWLCTPLFTLASGWEHKPHNELTEKDKALLKKEAAAVWDYFSELCKAEDGWLPPDNFQTQPPKGPARRSSPTNIGLCLLSALAAMDMELASRDTALILIENIMSTIERLPKWHGHLYNWYDNASLTPLQPVYVSTVDSGNFCACLLCLKNALSDYGRADLAQRAAALYEATELGALYDEKRELFYIGLDPVRSLADNSHYDLMASEARLTSFLAVARGDVPLKHWQALSRAQLALDGWRGLASWSGSVFEYLMPELFLPPVKGSLLWESARFCLYAQRRRARRCKAPWGNSESAYYAMDGTLDWRYKAHGTGTLALRRGMDAELVVSPYSSFLALCVHPAAALKNLRALWRAGMWGRFGFYEALDLTPGRTASGQGVVSCFMAHHMGMSMAAIDNCLCDGLLRRRFMSESCCGAFAGLLAERVPLGGTPVRRRGTEKPREAEPEVSAFVLSAAAPDGIEPDFFPLSNGCYHLLAGENGYVRALCDGILMYRPDRFFLQVNGLPLTPAGNSGLGFSRRYSAGTLSFDCPGENNIMSTLVRVASGQRGELRHITARAGDRFSLEMEPVLAPLRDWQAHPAFQSLGLECTGRDGAVLVRRLTRGATPELWFCIRASVPLKLTGGGGWHMFEPLLIEGDVPEGGCVAIAFAFDLSRENALSAAGCILHGGGADMLGVMAAALAMQPETIAAAMRLCTALARPRVNANELAGRELMWASGISGDWPLVYLGPEAAEKVKTTIRCHALLSACGVGFDLAINTGEAGDYLRPQGQSYRRFMEHYGMAPFENAPGGIHFVSDERLSFCAVRPAAKHCAGTAAVPARLCRGKESPRVQHLAGGTISFSTPPLPIRAWQNVLANERFGYIATDGGGGHMWLENAREKPITPWENDPLGISGPETLELVRDGKRVSLFADGEHPCRVSYGFGWARWDSAEASVTAFIPGRYAARVLIVEGGENAEILWHMRLALAPETADRAYVITGEKNGVLRAQNPRGIRDFRALCSRDIRAFTCNESSFVRGEMDGAVGTGLRPCFALSVTGGGVSVFVCGCEKEEILRALTHKETAARELAALRDGWRALLGRVRLKSGIPELDRMMNGWAAYQALSGRILGRSSIYQCGGAWGFRDQLQDAVNLIALEPGLARRQILQCCSRQFTEGDVLHWWHEDADGPRGVRSRCSDDLLWLCWALCEYVEKTGDTALCYAQSPWLSAPPLAEGERERYFRPESTEKTDSVLAHARRSVELVDERGYGPHGLLFMGSGDWNDGMDRCGGESVWLSMFCAHCADRLLKLVKRLGEPGAEKLAAIAQRCSRAANLAWDGGWYLRLWRTDSSPVGAVGSRSCEIDSLTQSWSVFCPGLPDERRDQALRSARAKLYDEAHGLTKLFAPPFGDEGPEPGYIRACGPGFRENGGQYTHGAIWLASAMLQRGMTEDGLKLLLDLLPECHKAEIWQAEPYVLAADVSSNADHYGCANWSWYTGSAGWFFRVVLEDVLGLRWEEGQLRVKNPALDYEAHIGHRHIRVKNGRATVE